MTITNLMLICFKLLVILYILVWRKATRINVETMGEIIEYRF